MVFAASSAYAALARILGGRCGSRAFSGASVDSVAGLAANESSHASAFGEHVSRHVFGKFLQCCNGACRAPYCDIGLRKELYYY